MSKPMRNQFRYSEKTIDTVNSRNFGKWCKIRSQNLARKFDWRNTTRTNRRRPRSRRPRTSHRQRRPLSPRPSSTRNERYHLFAADHPQLQCNIWQYFGFCTADFRSWLVYESAFQKPTHCLTCSFLHPLVRTTGSLTTSTLSRPRSRRRAAWRRRRARWSRRRRRPRRACAPRQSPSRTVMK